MLTEQEQTLLAAQELLARRQAREHLKEFILYTFPDYLIGKHHEVLFEKIERIMKGELKRLIVVMPPRHGKSLIVSRRLPAYYIGKNPDKFVVVASYGEELARDFGRDVRNLVADVKFQNVFKNVVLSDDSSSATRWNTDQGGGLFAVGVGSALTGRGADLAIIDDPVKDRQAADSETIRERIKAWYQSTLYTRLYKDSAVIVCMTRWHHDDLVGWLLNQEDGDQWEVLHLPAIAGEEDGLDRQPGEALWPVKFPLMALERIQRAIGPDEFEALYQGRPTIQAGKILKREHWRFWNWNTIPEEFDERLISIDPNLKETKKGSKACVHAWGRLGPNFYLLDRMSGRWDFSEAVQNIKIFCWKHSKAIGKLFEDTAAGPAMMSTLKNIIGGIIPISPRGKSKEIRAKAIQPYQVAGNIYLPEDKKHFPWVEEFIQRCSEFPHTTEVDDVDTMTQAINYWMDTENGGGNYDIGWSSSLSDEELEKLVKGKEDESPIGVGSGEVKKDGDMTYENAWM